MAVDAMTYKEETAVATTTAVVDVDHLEDYLAETAVDVATMEFYSL